MSNDSIPEFEKLLQGDVNDIICKLIADSAFSTEFLASCVAHYYATILKKEGKI